MNLRYSKYQNKTAIAESLIAEGSYDLRGQGTDCKAQTEGLRHLKRAESYYLEQMLGSERCEEA